MSVKPLNNHYSLTTPASIYDEEALTALELAGRTAAKVNENVEAFNKLEKETSDHLTAQDSAIKKMNDETMPAKVAAAVNEHIENGDFDQQIEQHIGNLENRVDNLLGSVTQGSTTLDAEIIDARVNSNGANYQNLGEHIRANDDRIKRIWEVGFYIGSDLIDFVPDTINGGGVLKCGGKLSRKDTASQTNIGYNWSDITTNIADIATVNGDSCDIKLVSHYILVFNVTDNVLYRRTNRNNVKNDDVVLFELSYGGVMSGDLAVQYLYKKLVTMKDDNEANNTMYNNRIKRIWEVGFYIGSDLIDFVPDTINGGGVLKCGSKLSRKDTASQSIIGYNWSDITTNIANIATVNGDSCDIKLGSHYILVFNFTDNVLYRRTNRNNVKNDDVVLFELSYGGVMSGDLAVQYLYKTSVSLSSNIKNLSNKIDNMAGYNNVLTKAQKEAFSELVGGEKETLLYFTDPHCGLNGDEWYDLTRSYIESICQAAAEMNVDFILGGGDWIGQTYTKGEAKNRLLTASGLMRKHYPRSYNVVGNHDYNYQYSDGQNQYVSPYIFTPDEVAATLTRGEGNTYYTFVNGNTKYFVFDTGVDWDGASSTIENHVESQKEWFMQELGNTTEDHIALILHIVYESTDLSIVKPFAQYVLNIAAQYNDRSEGFETATGKIEFVLTGHLHLDIATRINNIPVIGTINAKVSGDKPSFDLMCIDYDGGTVKTVRVGTGENRTINI